MKTIIILVPRKNPGLGPYDILDVCQGTTYHDENEFREQEWVCVLEDLTLLELPEFIQMCNDEEIDVNEYWLGYVYFRKFDSDIVLNDV